jgi:hypothetical protein
VSKDSPEFRLLKVRSIGHRLIFTTTAFGSGSIIALWSLATFVLDPFAKLVLGLISVTCIWRAAIAGRLLLKWFKYPIVYQMTEAVLFPKSRVRLPLLSGDCLLWVRAWGPIGLVDGQIQLLSPKERTMDLASFKRRWISGGKTGYGSRMFLQRLHFDSDEHEILFSLFIRKELDIKSIHAEIVIQRIF